jgi:hypothetical protein
MGDDQGARRDPREHRQVFGWYDEEEISKDTFTYSQVGSHYTAQPCANIGHNLIERAHEENVKYMTICIPSYNENKEEMYKTMLSLLQNADFFRKVSLLFTLHLVSSA